MRLLEHEAKEILRRYKIPLPSGYVVESAARIQEANGPVMLKAQIPLGGRGKSGAIIEAASLEEARNKTEHLLSTRTRGYTPKKVLVENKIGVAQEVFMAITHDTVAKEPLAIFSREGGVDVEELAATRPEKVIREWFSIRGRLPQYRAREILSEAGVSGSILLTLGSVLSILADIFLDCDATVAEINPLALTHDGKWVALDAHLEIDDDALYRHKDLAEKQADMPAAGQARILNEGVLKSIVWIIGGLPAA